MNNRNVDTANLNFLLFDWLGLRQLLQRSVFAEHSEESVTALLGLAEKLSNKEFLQHYKASDQSEPKLGVDGVEVLPAIKVALDAFANAGFFSAPFPTELDGLQVPEVVQAASMCQFMAA